MKPVPIEVQVKQAVDRKVRQRLIELEIERDRAVRSGDLILVESLDTDIKIMASLLDKGQI